MSSNKSIFLIIILFLILKSFFLSPNVWWDSAVYLGMGKYIASFGKSGLWEISRPLVWPLTLGFFWKFGVNIVVVGKILSILFAAGCVYMAYLVGKEVFDEKIALVAAAFMAFSPTFFFNSDLILTAIPTTFFGLLAVYCFLRKKFILAGLFSGIAFMTRFLSLIVFIGILLILAIYRKKIKVDKRKMRLLLSGFLVPVLPYLVLNAILYNFYVLKPFLLQVNLTQYTGWMWWEPLSFYFINLFKGNFLVVFSLVGLFLLFRKRNLGKSLIVALFLLFFVFYNANIHKEMRFTITFLPYLYMITAFGLVYSLNLLKKKWIIALVAVLLLGLWSYDSFSQYEKEERITTFEPFWDYVETAEGNLWITNPVFIIYSDARADELIYDHKNSIDEYKKLTNGLDRADHLLINTCDIPCFPGNEGCEVGKKTFMDAVKENFEVAYSDKFWDCEFYIFKK